MKVIALYRDEQNVHTDAALAEAMNNGPCRVAHRSVNTFNLSQKEVFDLALADLSAPKVDALIGALNEWGVEVRGVLAEGGASTKAGPASEGDVATEDAGAQSPAGYFDSMTVAELRSYAKEKSIPLPAAVNTKAEITAYLTEKLAETEIQ